MNAAAKKDVKKPNGHEQAEIALNAIVPREGYNSRTEITKDEDMLHFADSIRVHGLISPLSLVPYVNKSGEDTGKYWVACGSRRFFAMTEVLKMRGTVRATIRRDLIDDPAKAAEVNLAENAQRNDLKTADLARRCYEMVEGKYPGAEDGKRITISKVALAIGKSNGYVANLVRSWRTLSRSSKEAWHKEDLPTDFVVSRLAKCEDSAEQRKLLEEYRAQPDTAKGKSREHILPKPPPSSAKLKAAPATRKEREEEEEAPVHSSPTKREILLKIEKLSEGLDEQAKGDRVVHGAWIDALRWAVGDLKVLRARS